MATAERFRLRRRVGAAHGGPMEIEKEYSWSVVDTRTKRVVLELRGEYSSTSLDADAGTWTGVSDVRLAPDGRHVQFQVAGGPLRTRLIPGAERVRPLEAWMPPPELPVEIDGVVIDRNVDVAAMIDDAYRRRLPKTLPAAIRDHPPLWAARLYEWLEDTSRGPEVAAAVSAHLADESAKVRGAALHFFGRYPFAPGLERVVEIVEDDLTGVGAALCPVLGFEAVPGLTPLGVLAGRLIRRRERRERLDALDRRALRLVQLAVSSPLCAWPEPKARGRGEKGGLRPCRHAFESLLVAPTWLARNVAHVERARPRWPGRWKDVLPVLGSLSALSYVATAARVLVASKLVSRRELVEWARGQPYWERRWPRVVIRAAGSRPDGRPCLAPGEAQD